jgi:hypothetical protein
MSLQLNLPTIGCSGVARFIVKNAKGEVTLDTGEQKNMLLDGWFAANNTSEPSVCHVGTGTTPPVGTDTTLESHLAYTSTTTSGAGSFFESGDDVTGWVLSTKEFIWSFAQGAVVGNISEYGLNNSASNAGMKVRNLIKDSNGDPTTISITAQDQLVITWRMRKHIPGSAAMIAAENTQQLMLNNVLTDVTITGINPGLLKNWVLSTARPEAFDFEVGVRILSLTSQGAQNLYNCTAGQDLSASVSVTGQEGNASLYIGTTTSNPAAGVWQKNYYKSFPLDNGYNDTAPTKMFLFGRSGTGNLTNQNVVHHVIRFNPEFIVGKDKIFTISLAIQIARA